MAKRALGRGLGAIFEDVEAAYAQDLEGNRDIVRQIDVSLIKPNPYQPRLNFNEEALNELSKSISKHGLLQPIVVVEKDDGYMLLAGERRLRATKLAGRDKISAIVADIESENLRELALIENIQRENLNPIELANAYRELIVEYNITQDGLSDIIHKSRTQITNTMRLLSLSQKSKDYICEGRLSQGHAKIIVGLPLEVEEYVVKTVLGQKLSVRQTEDLVKNIKNETQKSNDKSKNKKVFSGLEKLKALIDDMGYKTKISSNTITIHFKDENSVSILSQKLKLLE